ncbi:MAG: Spy/CpxP family protein refolding chaperone [Thermoanaerobaculaceae bacterium]
MKRQALVLLGCLFGTPLLGQGLGPPGWDVPQGRWWTRPAIAEELGLSPEQKAKLEQIVAERLKVITDAREAVKKAQAELRQVAQGEPLDVQKARQAFQAVQEARARLENERFELLLRQRQVLTAEQWKKAQEIVRERVRAWREGRPVGPRHPGGPRGPLGPGSF